MKRTLMGLALLALLAAMDSADAQRRRLPSRTEPIPETETAAERAKEPVNPNMMIYGPPTPPLGAPPAAPAAVPIPEPAAKPAPAVVPAPPAPVAVPVPAPAPPPPPVAAPAPPPPPPPPPVAAPAPPPPPPPPPVARPAPVPPLPPVAVPAPVVVPPPAPAPVAVPKPLAPAPVAKPAPVPEKREVAAIAPVPAPGTTPRLDGKLVEQIFSCLAPGLPQDWKKTWVVVAGAEAAVATKFYVTTSYRDEDAEEYLPCNVQEIARRITSLNDALPPEQRLWKSARLAIDSEGEYELKYDYSK